MASIAAFNFTGISTTKHASALARSTIAAARTLLVWGFSMAVGWEDFVWLQLIGFVFLLFGTLLYNEVLVIPIFGFQESVEKHRLEKQGKADKEINDIATEDMENFRDAKSDSN